MITEQTTLAELQALREKLDISSLLVTLVRSGNTTKPPTIEVMAINRLGVAKFEAPTFAEALNGAFTLCANTDRKVKP